MTDGVCRFLSRHQVLWEDYMTLFSPQNNIDCVQLDIVMPVSKYEEMNSRLPVFGKVIFCMDGRSKWSGKIIFSEHYLVFYFEKF